MIRSKYFHTFYHFDVWFKFFKWTYSFYSEKINLLKVIEDLDVLGSEWTFTLGIKILNQYVSRISSQGGTSRNIIKTYQMSINILKRIFVLKWERIFPFKYWTLPRQNFLNSVRNRMDIHSKLSNVFSSYNINFVFLFHGLKKGQTLFQVSVFVCLYSNQAVT